MEVDLLGGATVQTALDLRQRREGPGPPGDPVRQACLLDEAHDVGVGAHHDVVGRLDDGSGGGDTGPKHGLGPETPPAEGQAMQDLETSERSAPASSRLPSAMSPAIPAKQWNHATVPGSRAQPDAPPMPGRCDRSR